MECNLVRSSTLDYIKFRSHDITANASFWLIVYDNEDRERLMTVTLQRTNIICSNAELYSLDLSLPTMIMW